MASARNAINVLIKLLGGDEMVAELEKLGTTGSKAIGEIQGAANKVSLANLGGAINNFGSDLATVGKRVTLAFAGISAAVTAAAPIVLLLAKSGAEAADSAGKAAQAAGLQAKSYQELAFAADTVGVEQEQFNTSMGIFNKQIVKTSDEAVKAAGKVKGIGKSIKDANADITQGAGYTVQAFKDIGVEVTRFGANASKVKAGTAQAKTGFDDLGIKVKNANGTLKTNEQLLIEVANAFQKMPDGARKSAIAIKLFGEQGAKLIPLLDLGAAGIDELRQKAAELGIIFTDDQIKAAAAFNDSLNELKKSVGGLLRQVGLLFLPAFTSGANAFRDIILRNRAAILSFTRDALATATTLIKDFFAVLSGSDSEVTSNKWLISWRDAIKGFGDDFVHVASNVVIPAMSKLRAAADLTIKAINGIFGTNVTTGEVLIGATILRMIGGFALLRSSVLLVVEAIAFLSRALLLTPAGRILLIIAGLAEVIGVLSRKQTDAAGTASAHQRALADLNAAILAVKNGVPGAEENLKRLAQAHLDAGKAAIANAKAQVETQQEIVDAMKQGGEFATPLGTDLDTQTEALVRANINLAKRERELEDIQNTINGKVVGNVQDLRETATKGAEGVTQLGTAADTTAGKVQNLDHQITVIRGGGAGGITKEVFDVIDGVAHRADQSKAALDGVADSAKTAADRVKGVSSEVTNSIGAIPDAIKPDAASAAVDGVVEDVSKIAPAAQEAASGVSDALGNIDASGAAAAAEAFAAPFTGLPGQISTIISGINSLVRGGFANLAATVSSLASQIRSEIAQIISALQAAVAQAQRLRSQASSSSSDGGGSHGGFAGGGDVNGAGTSTSDSILAWLSNGEFVTRARAVAYYGRDVFHAFNNMTLPKNFLSNLRGFNMGGAVSNFSRSMAIPRLASGGAIAVSPAASPFGTGDFIPIKLQYGPSVKDVIDLIGQVDPVMELQRFVLRSSSSSAGRRPGR